MPLALVLACTSQKPTVAPGKPPTPTSITMEHPGGDSADPEWAALDRQLHERWGFQIDKDSQLRVPLVDWEHYERVRYWAIDHFVGFKYGSDFYALNSVFILDVKDEPVTSDECFVRTEKWAHPQIKSFNIQLGEQHVAETPWRGKSVRVMTVDGYLDWGLERRRFSAAYAAYPAYDDACLVFGFAVPWGEHEELAKQVRDRWAKEGVPRLVPLTKTRPYRKDD